MTRRLLMDAGRVLSALLVIGAIAACDDPADPEPQEDPSQDDPPPIQLVIESPPEGAALSVSADVVLRASAQAADLGMLPDDSVFWTVDGTPLPPGRTHTIRLEAGQHQLQVLARWGTRTAQASRTVSVAGPPIGSVLWRGSWDGEPVQGRGGLSAGVDGTLYAHDFFGLWAFDPDGSDRWSFTGTTTGFEHPPTVLEDGSVVIGTEYGIAAVGPSGTMLWEYRLPDRYGSEHVHGGVAVGPDGTIYFGSENENGVVVALWPNGQERWVTLVQPADTPAYRFFPAPVIVGDTLLVLVTTHRWFVAAVDARDGAVKWRLDMRLRPGTPAPLSAPAAPAVADNGDVVVALHGSLVRVDPAGQIVWRKDYYGPLGGVPAYSNALAISGGRIYVPMGDGGLEIYDGNGARVARYGPGSANSILGGVTLGRNDVAYVLHADTLRSYAPDGTLRYATHIGGNAGTGMYYVQVPVIGADGTVYVRSTDGGIVAVADTVGPAVNAEWPTMGGGNRRLGRRH